MNPKGKEPISLVGTRVRVSQHIQRLREAISLVCLETGGKERYVESQSRGGMEGVLGYEAIEETELDHLGSLGQS